MKISENSSSDFELIYLMDEMKGFLSDTSNCKASFKGKSANYDEIDFLRSGKEKNQNIYEIFALTKKTYGQNNLRIKSMRLESSENEYNPKSGLTLFHVEFEKVNELSLVETSSKTMSVHIQTNDIGMIDNCYTLGSFVWSSGPKGSKTKWYNKNKKVIQYNRPGINIGEDVSNSSGVGVRGKVKTVLRNRLKCTREIEGMVGYHTILKSFAGCNGEKWESLHKNEIFQLTAEEIDFSASGNKSSRIETTKEFYYCEILYQRGDNGLCRLTPTTRNSLKTWYLVAEHYGGANLRCRARCFY